MKHDPNQQKRRARQSVRIALHEITMTNLEDDSGVHLRSYVPERQPRICHNAPRPSHRRRAAHGMVSM